MKNEASSARVSCSPSMFAVASAVTRSSPGRPARSAARPVTRSASSAPAVRIWPTACVRVLADEVGVHAGQDDVGVAQHLAVVVVRDSHHLADDGQRQPGGHVLDEVARAAVEQVIDDRRGHQLHVALELLDHPGGERARHDPAQPGVARVVHVDHRPEVLVELGRQVGNRGGAPAGGEHLRPPARLHDVGVPDQGVIPRPGLGEGRFGLGEERGMPGGAQHGERGPPLGERPPPELGVRQVDVRRG